MCMGRVQVYLPQELHDRIRELGLSPSELLQRAAREEIRSRELEFEADRYLEELVAEVGEPSAADEEHARIFVAEMLEAHRRRVG